MALKVKGSAFIFGEEVEAEDASISKFCEWLKEYDHKEQWPYKKGGYKQEEIQIKRNLYCNCNDNFFYGVFISAKNSDYQHYVKEENGKITVEKLEIGKDNKRTVELNFFCMERTVKEVRGIYSHYLGAYSLGKYLHDMWMAYKYFVDIKKSKSDSKKEYSTRKKNKVSPMYTNEEFEALLKTLKTVTAVRARVSQTDNDSMAFETGVLSSVYHEYKFKTKTPLTDVITKSICTIKNKISSNKKRNSGTVTGKNNDGEDVIIGFEYTTKDYLGFEYDDLITFDISALDEYIVINEMIKKLEDKTLF